MRPIQAIKDEWAEAKEAAKELWRFVRTHSWKRTARNSVKRKYWLWWLVGALIVAGTACLSLERDALVKKFEPYKDDIADSKWMWIIPVVVLIVLSIPPLAGHEIVLLAIGMCWGWWKGIAVATVGMFLGEFLCFFVFRRYLTASAAKIEHKSIYYSCLARLMRDGSLWIVTIMRYSAIPGHVMTAITSTVGMSLWKYSLAVILSFPRPLAFVYFGVVFVDAGDPEKKAEQSLISLGILGASGLATAIAVYILYMRARKLYPVILEELQAREAEEAAGSASSKPRPSTSSSSSSSSSSDSEDEKHRSSFLPSLSSSGSRQHSHRIKQRSSLAEAAFDGDHGKAYVKSVHSYDDDERTLVSRRGSTKSTQFGPLPLSSDEEEDDENGRSNSSRYGRQSRSNMPSYPPAQSSSTAGLAPGRGELYDPPPSSRGGGGDGHLSGLPAPPEFLEEMLERDGRGRR